MANYSLKTLNSTRPQLVYLRQSINGEPFKYSLGKHMKVIPADWDKQKQKYKSSVPNHNAKNKFLKKFKTKFESTRDDLLAEQRYVCHDELRARLDKVIKKNRKVSKSKGDLSFVGQWEQWMKILSRKLADSTVKKKGYTLNSLKKFSAETGYPLAFEHINKSFADKYREWAFNKKKKNGEFLFKTDNGVNKYISITMGFMIWATEEGINNCTDYTKIKGHSEEYFAPFALEKADVDTLLDLSFEDVPEQYLKKQKTSVRKLELARDAFVFRCMCGIRYSDFENISPSNFIGSSLSLVTIKTGSPVLIPLHERACALMEKYDFHMPALGNALENLELKLVSQLAGLHEEIVVVSKREGNKIYQKKKRWECVTTHTARKTFITSCIKSGMRQEIVMKIVGIKKQATLDRYIQITNNDIAQESEKVLNFFSQDS